MPTNINTTLLEDKDGNKLIPITKTNCVMNDEGQSLDVELEDIKDSIPTSTGQLTNDSGFMATYQFTYDGTNIRHNGAVATFTEIKDKCLDDKYFVYLTYQNRLYIPNYVTDTDVYFGNNFNVSGKVYQRRINIQASGVVGDTQIELAKIDDLSGDTPYELIEKIIIGYALTTSQPADWETNYTSFFINTGTPREPIYTAISGSVAPTWETNKYYSYSASGVTSVSRNTEPGGMPYNFKKLFIKHTKLQANPDMRANFLIGTTSTESTSTAIYFQGTTAVANQNGRDIIMADISNGILNVMHKSVVGGNQSTILEMETTAPNGIVISNSIKLFEFYRVSGSILQPGNTIHIYGVRA